MKTVIHVNQHAIKRNAKHGTKDPVITVKRGKSNTYGHVAEIVVNGDVVASVVYRPEKPLSCGARVWVETQHEVRVITQPPEPA